MCVIVENQYSGITYEKDGTLKSLTNGFRKQRPGHLAVRGLRFRRR